ncbi:MAG: zinc metalloprotease [Planctomycetota bacterium]|jgi:hypothetical protein
MSREGLSAILLCLTLGVGCGAGDGRAYPQTWELSPSANAIAQIEAIGWDAQTFYELVSVHAEKICAECNVEFHLGDGGGVVRIKAGPLGDGILGAAADGSGRATVNQAEVFHAALGPGPRHPALAYYTIDDVSYLFAVIVAHEVGHALSLPHNPRSTVMHEAPILLANHPHEFTVDEVDRMRSATGQAPKWRPVEGAGLCPCCISPGVRVPGCEE